MNRRVISLALAVAILFTIHLKLLIKLKIMNYYRYLLIIKNLLFVKMLNK